MDTNAENMTGDELEEKILELKELISNTPLDELEEKREDE